MSTTQQTTSNVSLTAPQPKPLPVAVPSWKPFVVFLIFWSIIAAVFYRPSYEFINWYATVFWSLPFGIAVMGIMGFFKSRPIIKDQPTEDDPVTSDQRVNVVITTNGKDRVLGALTRVVTEAVNMHSHLTNCHLHILTDEGCEAMTEVRKLADSVNAALIVVPKDYETPNKTDFKGRALHYYVTEVFLKRYGSVADIPEDEWNYYLDDDTDAQKCTSRKYAAWLEANGLDNPERKHLGQGILTYRRQNADSLVLWLADSIRTADDLFRFSLTTGSGTPRAGVHGENAMWRGYVDVLTGWDFGPEELVEDSRKALELARLFPGRSDWLTARVFGAPPTSWWDFAGAQRARWAWGMLRLALLGEIPLRERLLIMHNMLIWSTGIFQPALSVFFLSFMLGDYNVAPVTPWLAPLWIISVSYTYAAYWEGLKQNSLASGFERVKFHHGALMLLLLPLYSVLEGFGGTLGSLKHIVRWKKTFDGVAKPV